MGCWEGDDWHWQFQWRRNWLERDQEQWTFFQHAVSTVALQKHAKDRWVWPIDKSGCFSVSSTYKALHDLKYNGQVDDLLAHIWHMKIPPKAVILQWRLLHNALPSVDNLLRRGIVLPPLDSMCVMCNEQPETLPHFFFSCPIADQLWKYYFSWASISTVQPQTMRLHYCQYPQLCFGLLQMKGWDIVRSAVVWCIWNGRNNQIFRRRVTALEELKANLHLTVWLWLKLNDLMDFTFDQWIACLS
ncbi:uncharacterized protein LOC109791211 [Cajanus cajan]|uniref:Reverse transcriptase zinc-binding domain-containing protein n=1 Tax=Cajanus cajan TaxID=3821 RepID=A0A151QZP3_CAJCA|nr:uncharacterized protein LOC109791211 [Cajanus cajan]KYP35722.1 hypothetical protein KK1_043219 [Cajanus cajan]